MEKRKETIWALIAFILYSALFVLAENAGIMLISVYPVFGWILIGIVPMALAADIIRIGYLLKNPDWQKFMDTL